MWSLRILSLLAGTCAGIKLLFAEEVYYLSNEGISRAALQPYELPHSHCHCGVFYPVFGTVQPLKQAWALHKPSTRVPAKAS